MKLSYHFPDLTVHVVQEQRDPVLIECEKTGDVLVVRIKEAGEETEVITKVEGIKSVAETTKLRCTSCGCTDGMHYSHCIR